MVDLHIKDQKSVLESNVEIIRKAIKDTLKIRAYDDLKGTRDDFLMMENMIDAVHAIISPKEELVVPDHQQSLFIDFEGKRMKVSFSKLEMESA